LWIRGSIGYDILIKGRDVSDSTPIKGSDDSDSLSIRGSNV